MKFDETKTPQNKNQMEKRTLSDIYTACQKRMFLMNIAFDKLQNDAVKFFYLVKEQRKIVKKKVGTLKVRLFGKLQC